MRHERFQVPGSETTFGRACERTAVSIRCEIKVGTEAWHFTCLRNLSVDGFQIDWPRNCPAYSKVRLRIPGLQVLAADIRWRDGQQAGCQFVQPLSPYVLDHIVRHCRS